MLEFESQPPDAFLCTKHLPQENLGNGIKETLKAMEEQEVG